MRETNNIEKITIGTFGKYTVFCKVDDMQNSVIPYVHVSDGKDFDAAISIYENKYMYNISKDKLSDDECIEFDKFMESLNPYIRVRRHYWDLALIGWMFANYEFEYKDPFLRTKPDYTIIN